MPNALRKLLLFAVLALTAVVQAAAPNLPYQGRLDQDGKPLTGNFDFRFQLYSAGSGGSPVWTGLHPGVSVVGGAFSVKLGSTAVLTDNLLALPQLYLEVSVKRPAESAYVTLAGRQQLLHVPYAATSATDFRVNGTLLAGQGADGGTAVTDGGSAVLVVGPNSNGGATGGLKVTSPNGGVLVADGRSLETNGTLSLQPVNKQPVSVGGALNVGGQVNAPNAWFKVYDSYVDTAGLSVNVTPGRFYKVYFTGYLYPTSGGGDVRLFLRFNNIVSYKSHMTGDADGNFTDWDTTGIAMLRTVYGRISGVSGEFTVSVRGFAPMTHIYGHGMTDDYQYGSGSGIWSWTRSAGFAYGTANPTVMYFETTSGGKFVGTVAIYQVGPY